MSCLSWSQDTIQVCEAYRDNGYNTCTQYRDEGYNACSQYRDDGYNACSQYQDQGYNSCSSWQQNCCDWWPCSWGCDLISWLCVAWYWVSNWVCVAWYWVSSWVCVAWYWVSSWVCVAWFWVSSWVCIAFGTIVFWVCNLWTSEGAGWQPLNNQPDFNASTMLLLTDGTIFCQNEGRNDWWRLTPDGSGNYVNGTWSQLASTPNYYPLYYASAILKDGRVFVAGGEYNNGNEVEALVAKIYDPVTNTWTDIPTPTGWTGIGDASCSLLPDGRVLLGNFNSNNTALYDPNTNTWTAAGTGGAKDDSCSEETWTLLPDNTVLAAECSSHPKAEKYLIAQDKWVSAGTTPQGHDLVQPDPKSIEIGPALLMPSGTVFAVGATGHTALYTPNGDPTTAGNWMPGPDFPNDDNGKPMEAKDAPGCLMPNGHVMCVAGPNQEGTDYEGPTQFFDFDGMATMVEMPNPQNNYREPYHGRMLLLPTGQVMFSNGSPDVEVFTPTTGGPDPSWKPVITFTPEVVSLGGVFTVRGRQLNGLSQAVSYGDDATMATNYPLVRIRTRDSSKIWYCRSFGFSTMGVATGSAVHQANFAVPTNVDIGSLFLDVVANGIPSDPVAVVVRQGKG